MESLPIEYLIPIVFPLVFGAFWLGITWLIGKLSGWHALVQRYPNRTDANIRSFSWRSGKMGSIGANMRSVLTLDVCQTGLRVSLFWPFAAFNKPFLVPWDQIKAKKIDGIIFDETTLEFGQPLQGQLTITRSLGDEIATAAPRGKWRG
jgi:hypothetical protein